MKRKERMTMKERYETIEIEVIRFDTEDVITNSPPIDDSGTD